MGVKGPNGQKKAGKGPHPAPRLQFGDYCCRVLYISNMFGQLNGEMHIYHSIKIQIGWCKLLQALVIFVIILENEELIMIFYFYNIFFDSVVI